MVVEPKEKSKDSAIQSAFIKGGTLLHLLKITPIESPVSGVPNNELIKIKFEVDTNPTEAATFETKYSLLPAPFAVRLYDMPSLFAGKIHAVLCRKWNTIVKGRDFYDYVWYLSRSTKVNLFHLQKRMEQTDDWDNDDVLTIEELKKLLNKRFESIDFNQAKKDVEPFISDQRSLDLWSSDFFCEITKQLH